MRTQKWFGVTWVRDRLGRFPLRLGEQMLSRWGLVPGSPPCRTLFLALAAACLPAAGIQGDSIRNVQDDVGRRVALEATPRRIVSLAPSVTETLFALGVGDQVVGVTDLCYDPPSVRTLPRVGGMLKLDWESVLRLHPDLVVATTAGNDAALVGQAEKLRIPLYFTDAPNLNGLMNSLVRLASVVGSSARGNDLRRSLEERIRALEHAASTGPHPRVLFLVWIDPPVVPGSGTLLSDALRRAGVESVTADAPAGWPTYDLETLLLRKPEWIVAARHNASSLSGLAGRPGWRDLEAIKLGRLGTVSPAIERPSPRVVDAMEELRKLVNGGPSN